MIRGKLLFVDFLVFFFLCGYFGNTAATVVVNKSVTMEIITIDELMLLLLDDQDSDGDGAHHFEIVKFTNKFKSREKRCEKKYMNGN